MRLLDLARAYLADRIGLSNAHRADVLSVARRCSAQTGCTDGVLPTRQAITAWLQNALETGRSPACVARYRRILVAIYAWGAEQNLCQPVELPRVPVPRPVPQAWTVAEVSKILTVAASWPGYVGQNTLASDWWPALILTVYWTGARIGSIMEAQPSDWNVAGSTLTLRRTKNGRSMVYHLHPQAAGAIQYIYDPQGDRLFYWPHTRWWLYRVFRRIVEKAGVPAPKSGSGNLFHRLRRTCLSYCWAVDPSIAQRQADHSSARITLNHYIDPRIVMQQAKTAADVLPVPNIHPERQLRLFG